MIKIVRIPKKVEEFFKPIRFLFSKPEWRHIQTVVLAIAIVWGKRNIQRLGESMGPGAPHRIKINDFGSKLVHYGEFFPKRRYRRLR